MEKKYFIQIPVALLASALLVSVAIGQNGSAQKSSVIKDTIPKEKKIIHLDEAFADLEISKAELEKSMKEIDWQKIQDEIRQAMKIVKVDLEKMNVEMELAMKEVNMEKISKEVQSAISKIDMEKIKKEVEKINEIDLSQVQEELKKIKPEIEKAMAEAKVDIEKARAEIKEYNDFIDELEKDGLIKKGEAYEIRHENGKLIINNKQVSDQQKRKYESFLQKHKDLLLKSSGLK